MSFSFLVSGSAGEGMEGNSWDEIDAFRLVIRKLLIAAKSANLNIGITNVTPEDWVEQGKPLDTGQLDATS